MGAIIVAFTNKCLILKCRYPINFTCTCITTGCYPVIPCLLSVRFDDVNKFNLDIFVYKTSSISPMHHKSKQRRQVLSVQKGHGMTGGTQCYSEFIDIHILYTGHYPIIPCLLSVCFDDAMHGRYASFYVNMEIMKHISHASQITTKKTKGMRCILNHTLRKHITRVWDKLSISHELR